jgi:hypothetical protein
MLVSGKPNDALRVATIQSQARASSDPPPSESPVETGDDRLRTRLERAQGGVAVAGEGDDFRNARRLDALDEVGDVGARDERLALTRDDDAVDGGIRRGRAEGRIGLSNDLFVQSVEFVRAVDREGRDAVSHRRRDEREGEGFGTTREALLGTGRFRSLRGRRRPSPAKTRHAVAVHGVRTGRRASADRRRAPRSTSSIVPTHLVDDLSRDEERDARHPLDDDVERRFGRRRPGEIPVRLLSTCAASRSAGA